MSEEKNLKSWKSTYEFHIGSEELNTLEQLRFIDSAIGSKVSSHYGKPKDGGSSSGSSRFATYAGKIILRVRFELTKNFRKIVLPSLGRLKRKWHKHVSNSSRGILVDSDRIEIYENGSFAEMVILDSPDLVERLINTRASHWILCREQNQLLKKAVPRIISSLHSSKANVILGDCRDYNGETLIRPKLDKLLLRQVDYLGPVQVVSVSALREVVSGELHPHLWPLAITLKSSPEEIEYLPEVLGVGRQNYAFADAIRDQAIELVEHNLQKNQLSASVSIVPPGKLDVSYTLLKQPLVSIIIPSAGTAVDGNCYLVNAVRSIVSKSTYERFEFVIVADNGMDQDVIDTVEKICAGNVRWVRYSEKFNFSTKVNLGAVCARGEYLLFLNDDIEVVSADWIQSMLRIINIEKIGYAGALLFFQDQSIQHAGHIYKKGARHEGFGEKFSPLNIDQLYSNDCVREGVTAACSIISKDLFVSVGGFSELLPGNFNDVDFSLKVAELGYKSAVSGSARLYHFESKSRDPRVQRDESEQVLSRWAQILEA